MDSPIDVFNGVWREARSKGSLKHRNAVCVSTIDSDGYPNSRFVDLKGAEDTGFVYCTYMASAKTLV